MKILHHLPHMKIKKSSLAYALLTVAAFAAAPLVFTLSANSIAALTGFAFPQGGLYYCQTLFQKDEASQSSEQQAKVSLAEGMPEISVSRLSEVSDIRDSRMGEAPEIPDEQKRDILQMQIEGDGTRYKSIWVKNSTGNNIDIEQILNSPSPLEIADRSKPTVLIYHTHTTEAYLTYDTGWFDTKNCDRSSDLSLGVVAVGDVIADKLKSAGIGVIHDTKIYDDPMYSGAYKRSAKTIQYYLEKYPTIQIVLDVHRDSMIRDNGVRIKPTAKINGKKAAQIMIISGCEDEKSLEMPNWRDNLNLAVKLQNALEQNAPGITRPVCFKICQYNQQYSSGGLLLEVGTDVNTIDEAINSADIIGRSLCDVIEKIANQSAEQ